MRYVEADIKGSGCFSINLTPEMHRKLADWAIDRLHKVACEGGGSIDMKDTLSQAGFEFNLGGGTIEVTHESVLATLMELVGPSLREVFAGAMADNKKADKK